VQLLDDQAGGNLDLWKPVHAGQLLDRAERTLMESDTPLPGAPACTAQLRFLKFAAGASTIRIAATANNAVSAGGLAALTIDGDLIPTEALQHLVVSVGDGGADNVRRSLN
jgi:hypothetical protein